MSTFEERQLHKLENFEDPEFYLDPEDKQDEEVLQIAIGFEGNVWKEDTIAIHKDTPEEIRQEVVEYGYIMRHASAFGENIPVFVTLIRRG